MSKKEEKVKKQKLWMPLTKTKDGRTVGILSDTSIDRDGERMSKDLIRSWAKNKSLPMLANHKNDMVFSLGAWKNFKLIEKGKKVALTAEPVFFSKDASPLAPMVEKQIQESVAMGLNPGISIGAIVHATRDIEDKGPGGCTREWTEAELVEASFVPVQSNRNASFGHIAKSFDFDPDKKSGIIKEAKKMGEEDPKANAPPAPQDPPQEPPKDPPAEPAAEPAATPAAGESEDVKALKAENTKLTKSVEDLTKSVADLGAKLDKALKTPVNLPSQEAGVATHIEKDVEPEAPTIESSLAGKYSPPVAKK